MSRERTGRRRQPPLPNPQPRPLAGDALLRLEDGGRLLSQAVAEALVQQVYALAQGGGWTAVELTSVWQGQLRWARNRASLATDRRRLNLAVRRGVRGSVSTAQTDQLDPASLEAVVRLAERQALFAGDEMELPDYQVSYSERPIPPVRIWSEATNNLTAEARCGVAQAVIEPAEAQGMLSAGYLAVSAIATLRQTDHYEQAFFATDHANYLGDHRGAEGMGRFWTQLPYTVYTAAQCSMTVRDPAGTGSGWAGLTSFDWSAIDVKALGARALEKCLASRHPVALEPGRYTVILEPQAVADLLEPLMEFAVPAKMRREWPEGRLGDAQASGSPWYLGSDSALGISRSKLGQKVADERVTISHDPADPLLGIVPEPGTLPITWITNGMLTELGYSRQYAIEQLRSNDAAQVWGHGYRMSGGPTTLEEMIQSTKRGLLVSRFSQVTPLPVTNSTPTPVLCTGLTRDGLWLIENGKISKAVKNLRFTESPLFVLNSIEQLGIPVPVFRRAESDAPTPAIVPPLKVRDFSFTAMIDAV